MLQGVAPGRSLRVALPLAFCFLGMANAHIAGCMGIRDTAEQRPVRRASSSGKKVAVAGPAT